MIFEWDPAKAASNIVKHRVSFELAQKVWDDPWFDDIFDQHVDGEERRHAIGMVGPALLIVVFINPASNDEDLVRIISARVATSRERKNYEDGQTND